MFSNNYFKYIIRYVIKYIIQNIVISIKYLIIILLKIYKYGISPILPQSCIFYVTCSKYAEIAVKNHSLLKALWLIICRLSCCHAFYSGNRNKSEKDYIPKSLDNETFDKKDCKLNINKKL